MIVIARNNGPFYEDLNGNKERRGLIKGKVYDVVEWAVHNGTKWIVQSGDFINPKEPKFFVKVINEDGIPHDYWNDYFLSSEEMRELKVNQLI